MDNEDLIYLNRECDLTIIERTFIANVFRGAHESGLHKNGSIQVKLLYAALIKFVITSREQP